ncbi:hypothetical protein IAQ61_002055 [Plenodomus lingam]|uniref:uncharacterized protein n=1 Tax=Leptosphaeria maculans TaxID=5022 RepID=UPI00332445CC|nr:hypothetical protein IAQ61_002055 [Plenodomus lingam]
MAFVQALVLARLFLLQLGPIVMRIIHKHIATKTGHIMLQAKGGRETHCKTSANLEKYTLIVVRSDVGTGNADMQSIDDYEKKRHEYEDGKQSEDERWRKYLLDACKLEYYAVNAYNWHICYPYDLDLPFI